MPTATTVPDTSDRHLHAVPDTATHTPATPCPAWCALLNGGHEDGDRFHYSKVSDDTGLYLALSIDDGIPSVLVTWPRVGELLLDVEDIDLLIGRLAEKRAVLAAQAANTRSAA